VVDNLAKVHDDEITEFLHKEMHKATGKEGLESVTVAFLVPRVPLIRAPALPLGATGALLVMASAGMAVVVGAARLARRCASGER